MFERMGFMMPNADFDLYWTTIGWPQQLQKSLEESEKNLAAAKVCHHLKIYFNFNDIFNINFIAKNIKNYSFGLSIFICYFYRIYF